MAVVVDASIALAWALPDESSALHIEVEQPPEALTVIREGTAAAMRYALTAYDAAYVDLAAREGLVLATLDETMRQAAEKSGITIFQ